MSRRVALPGLPGGSACFAPPQGASAQTWLLRSHIGHRDACLGKQQAFLALHEKSLWEKEYKEEEIPEKMRLAATVCARGGEHEVALSLLRQA